MATGWEGKWLLGVFITQVVVTLRTVQSQNQGAQFIPRPHDGGLLDVLRPYPGAPVPHGEEVLREARVSLQGVDRAEMGVVDGRDPLVGGLGFLVAEKDAAC